MFLVEKEIVMIFVVDSHREWDGVGDAVMVRPVAALKLKVDDEVGVRYSFGGAETKTARVVSVTPVRKRTKIRRKEWRGSRPVASPCKSGKVRIRLAIL